MLENKYEEIYWNNNDDKKVFTDFNEARKELEKIREEQGKSEYEKRKEILYMRTDMKYLFNYGDKYYRILKFYKKRLVELGDMKQLKNSCKTAKYTLIKGCRKVIENETAC